MKKAEKVFREARLTFDIAAIRFNIFQMLSDLNFTDADAYKISSAENVWVLLEGCLKEPEFKMFEPVLGNLKNQKNKLFQLRESVAE